MMNSLFSRHIATVGLFLTLFAGVTVECVNAQPTPKPTPTAPKPAQPELTDEEKRQEAHERTLDAFKKLQEASAARQKAECEGSADDKKKAAEAFRTAKVNFEAAVRNEVVRSENYQKATAEAQERNKDWIAAYGNKSTPADYVKLAYEVRDKAYKKIDEVEKQEKERILREYADELKKLEKLAKCPPTEHGKSTDGKKRRKKDDTKQETIGDSPPGISIGIGIGGGRGREREHRRDRKKDELRRDDGGGGIGISPGITFGR